MVDRCGTGQVMRRSDLISWKRPTTFEIREAKPTLFRRAPRWELWFVPQCARLDEWQPVRTRWGFRLRFTDPLDAFHYVLACLQAPQETSH